ncbi:MAG: diacylglycerol kinase [Dehalococcoidia bacterium]|jgi:diacylglycerol kinase (ATP)|nr:diacylglycerol kinase [Dehalococcoidia bacterium]
MNRFTDLGNPLLLLRALRYSARGLTYAVKNERAFQQEIILLVVGTVAAFLLTDSNVERAVLIGPLAFVLVIELVNSAIEATIDRIGPEQHPLSQRAKDLGSAAVLVSLVLSAAVWLIVLI